MKSTRDMVDIESGAMTMLLAQLVPVVLLMFALQASTGDR